MNPRYTYAIGDAHGRFDLVKKAVKLAEQHCGDESGRFVCCGDFVDRGPQSRQIIEMFMDGPTLPNWEWVVLAGNHEDMMSIGCRSFAHMNHWIGNGGGQTLLSYGLDVERHTYDDVPGLIPQEHVDWLSNLPIYFFDDHRAFVHAGFDPAKTIEEQSRQHMTWTRDSKMANYSYAGRHVVHGHEQYEDGPILNKDKTNIDTFAWLYGRLAVAVFDNEKAGGPIEILWAEGEKHEDFDRGTA